MFSRKELRYFFCHQTGLLFLWNAELAHIVLLQPNKQTCKQTNPPVKFQGVFKSSQIFRKKMPCLPPGKETSLKILIRRKMFHQQTVISNTKEFFSRKRLVFILAYLLIYLFNLSSLQFLFTKLILTQDVSIIISAIQKIASETAKKNLQCSIEKRKKRFKLAHLEQLYRGEV